MKKENKSFAANNTFTKSKLSSKECLEKIFINIHDSITQKINSEEYKKIPILSFYEQCFLRLYFALLNDKTNNGFSFIDSCLQNQLKETFTLDTAMKLIDKNIRNYCRDTGVNSFMKDFAINQAVFAILVPPKEESFNNTESPVCINKFTAQKGAYIYIPTANFAILFLNPQLISPQKVNKIINLTKKDFEKVCKHTYR